MAPLSVLFAPPMVSERVISINRKRSGAIERDVLDDIDLIAGAGIVVDRADRVHPISAAGNINDSLRPRLSRNWQQASRTP